MLRYNPKTEAWTNQKDICNTNNHPCPNMSILEYRQQLSLTWKDVWIKYFPDPPGTITIPISLFQCKLLSEIAYIGFLKGERSKLFEDELNEFERYVDSYLLGNSQKWFIRLNEASSKDGKKGCGPLYSVKDIVTSLSTSMRAHRAFKSSIELHKPDTLYVIPWREDWNDANEFRVFVYRGKVTAFSQYVWFRKVGWNDENIKSVAENILLFCNKNIIPKFPVESFVVDVIIVGENVEIVEFNSYGRELSSGSALFHWINDHDILYSDGSSVEVRYIDS